MESTFESKTRRRFQMNTTKPSHPFITSKEVIAHLFRLEKKPTCKKLINCAIKHYKTSQSKDEPFAGISHGISLKVFKVKNLRFTVRV